MKLFKSAKFAQPVGHTNAAASKLSADMTALNNKLFQK